MNSNQEYYKQIHENVGSFGAGDGHDLYIAAVVSFLRPNNVLDYGCGKGRLVGFLKKHYSFQVDGYDPSVSGFSELPENRFDLLTCTDVLEHIPEFELEDFLKALKSKSSVCLLIPHLQESSVYLPDGTNVHCTIKTTEEWKKLLSQHWVTVNEFQHHSDKHAAFIVSDEQVLLESLQPLLCLIADTKRSEYYFQRRTIRSRIGRVLQYFGLRHYLKRVIQS